MKDALAEVALANAKQFVTDMFGPGFLEDTHARKAFQALSDKLDNLRTGDGPMDTFEGKCADAVSLHVKTCVVKIIAAEMVQDVGPNNAGTRLYDALGAGNEPGDRGINADYFWNLAPDLIETRFFLGDKGPAELRGVAAKTAFRAIAEKYADKLPPLQNEHPHLRIAMLAVATKVANDLQARFDEAVTDEDFAQLAADFKTRLDGEIDRTNTTLRNIDLAKDQAKAELEGCLEQMAGQYGFPLTQGIRDMLSRTLGDAVNSLRSVATGTDKALSIDECKAAILDRIDQKWLAACRQAAAEIEASTLEPAQKKAFLAKTMAGKVDVMHVKMALRLVPAFDAKDLVNAAKAGNGQALAAQLFQFVATTRANITDQGELGAIKDSDQTFSFVGTSTDLLFAVNPGLEEGIRGLDADAREKMFDDAVQTTYDKSRENQDTDKAGGDKAKASAMVLAAKNWSSATFCVMQLQQAID